MPEQPQPGSSSDWLRRARSDLALARIPLPPDVLYGELCFHAQQAVEKSIKAVLIHDGVEFRRVHDIAYLLGLLPADISLPPEVVESAELTSYATLSRYPGEYEEITEAMYRKAVEIAGTVFSWVEQIIAHGTNPLSDGERHD